jgi:hypothetical protein
MVRKKLPDPKPGRNPYEPCNNTWFITINSNTHIPSMRQALEIVWRYVISHTNQFVYGRKGAKLLKVREHHAVEQGKKSHRIHLHGYFQVRTTGIAFLDYDKINEFVNVNLRQIPGFKRCNFQAKLMKDQVQNAIDYIDKDQNNSDSGSDSDT